MYIVQSETSNKVSDQSPSGRLVNAFLEYIKRQNVALELLSALLAAAAADDRKLVDICRAVRAEQSNFPCLDLFRFTARVVSTSALTATVLYLGAGLALGFGVDVDVAENDLSAGRSCKQ